MHCEAHDEPGSRPMLVSIQTLGRIKTRSEDAATAAPSVFQEPNRDVLKLIELEADLAGTNLFENVQIDCRASTRTAERFNLPLVMIPQPSSSCSLHAVVEGCRLTVGG